MKILLTGGKGQLAWDILYHPDAKHFQFVAVDVDELDITDLTALKTFFEKHQPDLILNTAAYTAVDKAEQDRALAFKVNRDGPKHLAELCQQHQRPLIHISTDYVFDGQTKVAYTEKDAPHPINVYGESKWAGELCVQQILPQHIILRVSGVFGFHGHNFVKTMLRLFQEKESLSIVNDQVTCPTPAPDIASVLLQLLKQDKLPWGLYHYCASEPVSWYDFACVIFEEAKKYRSMMLKTIQPIPSKVYKTPATRPQHSVLNCDKIQKIFNMSQKTWRIALSKLVEKLLS